MRRVPTIRGDGERRTGNRPTQKTTSKDETEAAVGRLRMGKTAGVDVITGEISKSGGDVITVNAQDSVARYYVYMCVPR